MLCGRAMRQLAADALGPNEFRAQVFKNELKHPDGFVMLVADFFEYVCQRQLFAGDLCAQEGDASSELRRHDRWLSLPRQCQPGKEWRPLARPRPVSAGQGFGQLRAAFRGGAQDLLLRTGGRRAVMRGSEQSGFGELIKRVVDLSA